MTIRNVVVGRLRPGVDPAAVRAALDAIAALDPPGQTDLVLGTDAGLREGNWDFAITSDFADEAAYRAYDTETVHNRVRAELFAPIAEQIVRIQLAHRPGE